MKIKGMIEVTVGVGDKLTINPLEYYFIKHIEGCHVESNHGKDRFRCLETYDEVRALIKEALEA
jgi:hypothetical protein